MNEEDVIEMLRREVARAGSGAAWARKHGFSRAYISDLLTGKSGRSEIWGLACSTHLVSKSSTGARSGPCPQSRGVGSNGDTRRTDRWLRCLRFGAWVWTGQLKANMQTTAFSTSKVDVAAVLQDHGRAIKALIRPLPCRGSGKDPADRMVRIPFHARWEGCQVLYRRW